MRNQFKTHISLRRIDACNLLIACAAMKELSNDGGDKWEKLHNMLKVQLDELDRQLDEI